MSVHGEKLKAVGGILKRHFTNLSVQKTIDIAEEIIDACIVVEEVAKQTAPPKHNPEAFGGPS